MKYFQKNLIIIMIIAIYKFYELSILIFVGGQYLQKVLSVQKQTFLEGKLNLK